MVTKFLKVTINSETKFHAFPRPRLSYKSPCNSFSHVLWVYRTSNIKRLYPVPSDVRLGEPKIIKAYSFLAVGPFCCAPGRAHLLEGESPLHAR